MKGEILYRVLDLLEDKAMETSDFFEAILRAGYGASFGKLEREHRKLWVARHKYQMDRENKRRLQKYISKLKKGGFIFETISGNLSLSKKGERKLKSLENGYFLNKRDYKKETGDKIIIVSYDVPVLFNKERNSLRDVLKVLGFSVIHKSVWVGKVKLPESFIKDLERLKILDYVEIIEITGEGTLKYKNRF
jgi:hypothetical protein